MNQYERQVLQYRPKIEWNTQLNYLVEKGMLSPQIVNSYVPTLEVVDATSILASAIISDAQKTQNKISSLMKSLENYLATYRATETGFLQYLDYIDNEDDISVDNFKETIYNSINTAATQVEAYLLLKDIDSDIDNLIDRVGETFFPNISLDSNNLVKMSKEEEEANRTIMIADATSIPINKTYLYYKSYLLHSADEELQNSGKVVEQIEDVLCHTIDDQFQGQSEVVISDFANMNEQVRTAIKTLNKTVFNKLASTYTKVIDEGSALGINSSRTLVWEDVATAMEFTSTVAAPTLNWFKTVDLEYGAHPASAMIGTMIKTIEEINNDSTEAALDLFKLNELDNKIKISLLEDLQLKKQARQRDWLLGALNTSFNFADQNPERQVNRFIKNNGLKNSGTILTR